MDGGDSGPYNAVAPVDRVSSPRSRRLAGATLPRAGPVGGSTLPQAAPLRHLEPAPTTGTFPPKAPAKVPAGAGISSSPAPTRGLEPWFEFQSDQPVAATIAHRDLSAFTERAGRDINRRLGSPRIAQGAESGSRAPSQFPKPRPGSSRACAAGRSDARSGARDRLLTEPTLARDPP
jgi:hypothetical protein